MTIDDTELERLTAGFEAAVLDHLSAEVALHLGPLLAFRYLGEGLGMSGNFAYGSDIIAVLWRGFAIGVRGLDADPDAWRYYHRGQRISFDAAIQLGGVGFDAATFEPLGDA